MSDNVNIDFQRKQRLGFPEVIYGEYKTKENLVEIIKTCLAKTDAVLVTRVNSAKTAHLTKVFPDAIHDEQAGILIAGKLPVIADETSIAVLSGGTSDEHVVREIRWTLRFLGYQITTYQDIGVSGLHRFLDKQKDINTHKILIVVAGFEAALPSIVGGLMPQPVICVPTSIGYGVNKDGKTALNAMLGSCANGLTVVNIDNGYGAAIAAYRIMTLITGNND